MVIGKEIKRHAQYQKNYLEIFKYIITKKRLSQRFPDNEEFGLKILSKDIYNFQSKNKLFLLEQLENFNNKERVDIENLIADNVLTIEHIMPQKLTPFWRETLGKDYESIHETYLHTLGNITLTGYNSNVSNKSFLEKRDMELGFKESRLFLNKNLQNIDTWDDTTITTRATFLRDRAIEIWTFPETSYESEEDNMKFFTLMDDDISFAGEKIISYQFMENHEKNISSWKKLYKEISDIIYALDPLTYKSIIKEHKYEYTGDYRDRDGYRIDDEFYLYVNITAEIILTRLRIILESIGLDLTDLGFTIK